MRIRLTELSGPHRLESQGHARMGASTTQERGERKISLGKKQISTPRMLTTNSKYDTITYITVNTYVGMEQYTAETLAKTAHGNGARSDGERR